MELHTILIILFSIPVLWVVGWIAINVGKVGYYVVQAVWKTRGKSRRRLQHPELGKLAFDGDAWRGQLKHGQEMIDFTLAGTEAGPYAQLSERYREIVRWLPGIQAEALAFLRRREPRLAQEQLTLVALDFPSAREPGVFGLAFKLRAKPENSWRVEFEADQPKFVGRND